MDKEIFMELLVEWAAFSQNRRAFDKKIRVIAKKAGVSKQLISYHLKKRKAS